MPKKTKPVDEARLKLSEKLEEVKGKANQLQLVITAISNEAVSNAEIALKETSKSKFLNKYSKVSQDLESCLSKFLLVSDALVSLEDSSSDKEDDSDEDEDEGEDEEEGELNDDTTVVSPTCNQTKTKYEASDAANNRTITPEIKKRVEPSTENPRRNSEDSVFSSVSTRREKIEMPQKLLNSEISVQRFNWEADVAYPVLITNFLSPWEFHVQIVNPKNDIMEQMCIDFMKEATNGYKGGIDSIPSVGMFCCAKSNDGSWYRAKIVAVYENHGDSLKCITVKVFFVDEGFYLSVGLSHIRPLLSKYATMLPAQSLHCILGGVQPIDAMKKQKTLSFSDCSQLWSMECSDLFQQKIDVGTIFIAYLYFPPKSAYSSPHNIGKDILVCDLYIHDPAKEEVKLWCFGYHRPPIETHMSYIMVVNDVAYFCGFFNSELNRKKSQRAINLAKEKKKEASSNHVENKQATRIKNEMTSDVENGHRETEEEKKPILSTRLKTNRKQNVLPRQTSRNGSENGQKRLKIKKERRSRNSPRSSQEKTTSSDSSICSPEERTPSSKPNSRENKFNYCSASSTDGNSERIPMENKSSRSSTTVVTTNSTNVTAVEENMEYQFLSTFTEVELNADRDTFMKVLVSEVVNPGLFYVHLVAPEAAQFDGMMDELNSFYNTKYEEIAKFAPTYSEGMAVAARFSGDDKWCRALIISKVIHQQPQDDQARLELDYSSSSAEDQYNLLYVDFGSSEVVHKKRILPICEKFCALPMETIPCSLADIEPICPSVSNHKKEPVILPAGEEERVRDRDSQNDTTFSDFEKWSEKSIARMKTLVLNQLPLMLSLKGKTKNSDGLFEVYLYDTTNGKDLFLNQLLVDECIATSKVFSKKTPVVRIEETQLEPNKDEDDLSSWDPMGEQYTSDRNAYSVNVNDPAVAMLGYVEKPKNVCYQYFRGRCYRGSDCQFAHVKPGEYSSELVEVFCDDSVVELPSIGDWVPATVTALIHPTHFWVNFPCGIRMFCGERRTVEESENSDCLSRLNDEMNQHYSRFKKREEKTDLSVLAEGELVAALFEDVFYRARIISSTDNFVQVYYVDYGNTAVISEKDVRKLLPDFLHLPMQAVECHLHGLNMEKNLKENNVELYRELRNKFKDLTADKLLMAQIISSSPRKELIIELYDTSTNPHQQLNEVISTWNGMVREETLVAKTIDGKEDVSKEIMYPG